MYQRFNFSRIVGESAYPGLEIEETFSGVVNLPENDDDEAELISVKHNGLEMNNSPMFSKESKKWKAFYAICFEAARDAQWIEKCKKERA